MSCLASTVHRPTQDGHEEFFIKCLQQSHDDVRPEVASAYMLARKPLQFDRNKAHFLGHGILFRGHHPSTTNYSRVLHGSHLHCGTLCSFRDHHPSSGQLVQISGYLSISQMCMDHHHPRYFHIRPMGTTVHLAPGSSHIIWSLCRIDYHQGRRRARRERSPWWLSGFREHCIPVFDCLLCETDTVIAYSASVWTVNFQIPSWTIVAYSKISVFCRRTISEVHSSVLVKEGNQSAVHVRSGE